VRCLRRRSRPPAMSRGCVRLRAHSATNALKQRLDPPETLARDPKRRDPLFTGRDTDEAVMYGFEILIGTSPHVDAPQTAAARATDTGREISKIFLEAF
jgi:hypothetical protein